MKRDIRRRRGFSLIELLACQPKPWRSQARSGFSLVELLVVIVIIGILFAVGLALFGNARKKNPDQVAGQVIGILRLARQHAVSARQWTLVVFPTLNGGAYTGNGGDDVDKCLRSIAVLGVVNTMDGLARPDQIPPNMEFEFVKDWQFLPEGIYFDEDPNLPGNYLFQTPSTTFEYPMDPATPDIRVRPMSVVLFRPNGRAYAMDGSNPNGKFWQDKDHAKIYLTSEKYYEVNGGTLAPPTPIPGTRSVIEIGNKTGQVCLGNP